MRRVDEFLNTQHSLGPQGKLHYVWGIKAFDRLSGAHFEDTYLNEKTIHATLAKLEKEKTPSSWNLYLGVYKRYAKWLSDPDDLETPKCWKKIRFKKIDWEQLLKDKWFTELEFRALIQVPDHPRDKALYAVINEGALRIGEALGLRIRDAKPVTYGNIPGYDITVSGKTGTSSFPMVRLAPLLTAWLNVHPLRHDPDAPLWITKRHGVGYTKIKDGVVNWNFKRHCKEAGITRKVSIHMLRHTKITWTAANTDVGVSDEMAKKMFRWKQSSRMYSRYVHMMGLDAKKTYLALAGIKEEATVKPNILASFRCVGCGELNPVGALYCSKCGLVLDEEQARRIVAKQKLTDDLMKRILEKGDT